MPQEKLWTRDFIALIATNGALFAAFHFLLPTLPMYATDLGATGTEIGIIGGIFGYAAIFIRLFTDTGVRAFGKRKCLYAGLILSIISTIGYFIFDSVDAIIFFRITHGIGFGLSTTFAAAIAADVIPAARRGEGIGYFGLGSTVAMAIAPALGIVFLTDVSPLALCAASTLVSCIAMLTLFTCKAKEVMPELPTKPVSTSLKNRLYENGTGVPSILTILFGAAYGSVNTFIAMMAIEAGIESAGIFFLTGTLFIFISRPFGGRLLDRYGAFSVILPGAISYLIALAIIVNATTLTMLLTASVFYGLGAGLLLPALMTWMLNVVRADRRSSASATFYNMLDIGTATGLLVLGHMAGDIGYIAMYKYVLGIMIIFLAFTLLQHFFIPAQQGEEVQEVSEL